MKALRYICVLVLCACSLCTWSQDHARMSERTLMGTARFVGMSGAMTAIGGDPSAALYNPAGLGLYRRMEVSLTFDYANLFSVSQASWVLSFPANQLTDEGLQFNNIMFSYHRLHSYRRGWQGASTSADASLGYILASLSVPWDIPFCADPVNKSNAINVQEYGVTNDFGFDWSANISNRWFVGAGLHVQNYSLSADGDYIEYFNRYNLTGVQMYNRNTTKLLMNGVGCNASVGLLYRPTGWLRLGFGLQTPSLGALNIYSKGTLWAQTDSLRPSYAPENAYRDNGFHRPLQTSASVAFQIGAYGMIAVQYDYQHGAYRDDIHSLRAGFEVIPILGMYINAGYTYESTFKRPLPAKMDYAFNRQDTYSIAPHTSQYASAAIGYRGEYVIVQAAYQYHWQKTAFWAHEDAMSYDMLSEIHRVVLTLGWHR